VTQIGKEADSVTPESCLVLRRPIQHPLDLRQRSFQISASVCSGQLRDLSDHAFAIKDRITHHNAWPVGQLD
jgi:hypothetical protein